MIFVMILFYMALPFREKSSKKLPVIAAICDFCYRDFKNRFLTRSSV
jgi:hypothetical protein